MRIVFHDELLEEEHVALEFVREGVLSDLDLAGVHVWSEGTSAVDALDLVDVEGDGDVLGHQQVVHGFLLDLEGEGELVLGLVREDPAGLEDLDELKRGDLGETELEEFLGLGGAFEPLVVGVEEAVAGLALVDA